MSRRRLRWDERGSASIEAVVVGPAVVLLILLVVFGGRVALAHQTVQTSAADAARAASLARSKTEARHAAEAAVTGWFDQQLPCTSHTLQLDVAGFDKPVGTPAGVTATLTCRLQTSDLGLPGLPDLNLVSTMTSPIDTYRARR